MCRVFLCSCISFSGMCIICLLWAQHMPVFCYSCYFWVQIVCCLLFSISVLKQTVLKYFTTDFTAFVLQQKMLASLQPRLQHFKVTIFNLMSSVSCILCHFYVSLLPRSLCLLQMTTCISLAFVFTSIFIWASSHGHEQTQRKPQITLVLFICPQLKNLGPFIFCFISFVLKHSSVSEMELGSFFLFVHFSLALSCLLKIASSHCFWYFCQFNSTYEKSCCDSFRSLESHFNILAHIHVRITTM